MNIQISGKVIHRTEKRSGVSKSGKAWSCIDYVIEEEQNGFKRRCLFTIMGEENVLAAMKSLHKGTFITAYINVDATEFKGKFYNSLTAWKIIANNKDIFSGKEYQQQALQQAPQSIIQQEAANDAFNNDSEEPPF